MHVAGQLFTSSFRTTIAGKTVPPEDAIEGWSPLDRFGIVVTEPLGALGASLLMQLVTARFYDVMPERRTSRPTYPEIYLFHAGGPYGNFSYFDFWPPRKEMRLPAQDPQSVLEAINACGVTCLAVPAGPSGSAEAFHTGPSIWAEQASAKDRLRWCFSYDSSGAVEDADLTITAADDRVYENIRDTLRPLQGFEAQDVFNPEGSSDLDTERWVKLLLERAEEVDPTIHEQFSARFAEHTTGRSLTEIYRRITADEALERVAGLGSRSVLSKATI